MIHIAPALALVGSAADAQTVSDPAPSREIAFVANKSSAC